MRGYNSPTADTQKLRPEGRMGDNLAGSSFEMKESCRQGEALDPTFRRSRIRYRAEDPISFFEGERFHSAHELFQLAVVTNPVVALLGLSFRQPFRHRLASDLTLDFMELL